MFEFFVFRAHLDSLLDYVKTGLENGATLTYGGKQVEGKGNYVLQGVIENLSRIKLTVVGNISTCFEYYEIKAYIIFHHILNRK